MRATAEPVDGNRVRLSIEVDAAEVDDAMADTVRRLARQVRVPGFRPGKVPRQVLEARLGGAAALRQQAVSDLLPDLYARAVADTAVDPIAAPELDVHGAEGPGPLTVDAVVEVRPTVSVAGYQGLQVTLPAVGVSDDEIERQVDRLRNQHGELVAADRPARDGDHITIDLHGTRPGADDLDVEDYVYELGSGAALPGLDDQLRGVKPGDILTFTVPVPGAAVDGSDAAADDDGDADAGGGDAPPAGELAARVLVKDVQQKVLPDATDAWAAEASEFETVDELRADLRTRLGRFKRSQARLLLRERVADALVELVADDPPPSMVEAEVNERLHDLSHRLEQRRMTVAQFLDASGQDEQGLVAELRAEAARAVQLDLALRAVADAEAMSVSDDELDQAIAEMASQVGARPADVRDRLERAGRLPAVRSERRKAKALAWLEEHVEIVDEEGAPVSRDDLMADDERSPAYEPTGGIELGADGADTVDSAESERSGEQPQEGQSVEVDS